MLVDSSSCHRFKCRLCLSRYKTQAFVVFAQCFGSLSGDSYTSQFIYINIYYIYCCRFFSTICSCLAPCWQNTFQLLLLKACEKEHPAFHQTLCVGFSPNGSPLVSLDRKIFFFFFSKILFQEMLDFLFQLFWEVAFFQPLSHRGWIFSCSVQFCTVPLSYPSYCSSVSTVAL